jgi:hypothetical protein
MDSSPTDTSRLVTLRIDNLPVDTDREAIRTLVAAYGAAERIRLSPPANGAGAIGYCDLPPQAAEIALAELDGRELAAGLLRASLVAATPTSDTGWPRREARLDGEEEPLPSAHIRLRYEVASVEPAELGGSQGTDWYRYVLASGRSMITGMRRGSLEEVTEYARDCAHAFNLRSATGKGSRALGLTPRK